MIRVRGGSFARTNFPKQSLKVELPKGYTINFGEDTRYEFDEFGFDDLPGSNNSAGILEKSPGGSDPEDSPPSQFGINNHTSNDRSVDNFLDDNTLGSRVAPASPQTAIRELKQLGAARTMWFTPGNSEQIGFAAFFPDAHGQATYRFSAIAQSESQAIGQVLTQVREWLQSSQGAAFPTTDPEQQTEF